LDISFETKQLREICEIEAEGDRHLGPVVAKSLRKRLADCEALPTVSELIVGGPRELGDGTMSLNLENGCVMVFTANHQDIPTTRNGQVDWTKVQSIRILRIEAENEPS